MAQKAPQASTPGLMDAMWLQDLSPGQRTWVGVTVQGVPCMFTLEADAVGAEDVGWVRVVGLAVGPQSVALTGTDANERAAAELDALGTVRGEPLPDITDVLTHLRTYALREMSNWEDTRRFARAAAGVTHTTPDRETEDGKWIARLKHSERVELAAKINNAARSAGVEDAYPMVCEWMGVSERTLYNLLNAAEAAGIQVERGSVGRPKKGQK